MAASQMGRNAAWRMHWPEAQTLIDTTTPELGAEASAPALMAKALGPARAVVGQAFIRWCARPSVSHTPPQNPHCRAMKMPSWLKKTKNDGEASSSSFVHRHRRPSSPPPALLLGNLPPAPRPEDYVQRSDHVVANDAAPRWDRCYVPIDECKWRWRHGEGIDHHDVSLPAD
jgi:hypothetical protein